VIKRTCEIDGKNYTALLDSGSELNIVSKKACDKIGGTIAPGGHSLSCVGNGTESRGKITLKIRLGRVTDTIEADVVRHNPVDIILGHPFLLKHSEGYRRMRREFPEAMIPPERSPACIAILDSRLKELLKKYPELILEKDQLPPPERHYKGAMFKLGIPDEARDKIFFRAQYPPKSHEIEQYRKILLPLIRAGVYRPTNSPHNNPVMLVPKKNPGEFRIVVDSRMVNRVCRPVGGLSASTIDVIRVINGGKIFSTLDCKNAFYSLELVPEDRAFTAISPPGLPRLESTRMPMGAKASTAALYQAIVNTVGEALYQYVVVWADDMLIYSPSIEDHIKHVDDILHKLDENGFSISKDKIVLGKPKVKWLGYEISEKGVQPDQEKIHKLLGMRRPVNIKELRSVIGMLTYFAEFIPRYSIIAAPLLELMKKGEEYKWTERRERAWDQLKQALASAPVMGYPDYSLPLYLHTDACKSGFAAILTQDQPNGRVIIDAASRTTHTSEKKYDSSKLECACIIWIVRKWKHHLYPAPNTVIVTDSYGIQYLQDKSTESTLVQRWICEMEGFRYTVRYRKGMLNIADFLSRQNDVPQDSVPLTVAPVETRSKSGAPKADYKGMLQGRWRPKQDEGLDQVKPVSRKRQQAPCSQRKKRNQDSESRKEEEKETGGEQRIVKENVNTMLDVERIIDEQVKDEYVQKLWRIASQHDVKDANACDIEDALHVRKVAGIIVKDVHRVTGEVRTRIVVPRSLQREVVQLMHKMTHAGRHGTYQVLQLDHWFRGMKRVVREVVSTCPECIAVKGRALTKEVMAPDDRPMTLGDRWHVDGLHLPLSKGYDHLMVAVDVATKYVILVRSKGETAHAAAKLLREIATRFGRPKEITSDRGRAFMSHLFMEACQLLLIRFKPVGIGQPQANGMVERVNRTLIQIATLLCKGDDTQWADYVKELEYAVNTRISSVTRFSPYELVFGRIPPGPQYMDVIQLEGTEGMSDDERVRLLRRRVEILQQLAHMNQMEAAIKQQEYHDAHAQAHTFNVDDTVWLYKQSSVGKGLTSKLKYSWRGPYTISEVVGTSTFKLKDKEGKELPNTYHSRFLYKVET